MSDPRELSLTWTSPQPHVARVALIGDLDHGSAERLSLAVDELVHAPGGVRELRLDCADLGFCDSSGLSSLLLARRRTGAAGIALHLDNRRRPLERLLQLTNTLEHLTGPAAHAREERLDT